MQTIERTALTHLVSNEEYARRVLPHMKREYFDDRIEIDAAIPGLTKNDGDIEIADGVLTIKAEANQRIDVGDSQYMKREVKRSAFARSFKLGDNLDESGVVATHTNGVLLIIIPKGKETNTQPSIRKIEIS